MANYYHLITLLSLLNGISFIIASIYLTLTAVAHVRK